VRAERRRAGRHADRDRIDQVLGNLIGNAVRFTPRGRAGPGGGRAATGEWVRFSVTDTGVGIDTADLPHVFDRFWQAKRSREGGAGLGLAIARGIVVAHGGEMWVESERESGEHLLLHVAGRSTDGVKGDRPSIATPIAVETAPAT
jgi:signal transduction histidine kinase